ncbi:MAG: histidine phosphatase family protein [Steroidobacteraceae bacterium]|jgi:phosphohistidine phosphatase|nr:histidine phosphatase family protein [Steroidobacteraceae bacterium]
MLRLTLIRHAAAQAARGDQRDFDRALEARGRREASEMARRLAARQLKPTSMLTSPAVRARDTADVLAREFGAPDRPRQDDRLYLAAPKALMEVIQELGGQASHLMVVGHNPGLSEFANELSSERSVEHLPTCGVYTVQFAIADWRELEWLSGVNPQVDFPGADLPAR